ncbi:EAL domain-containing protein [Massilia sp. R2A-15]|uniref:EAL domain-containing protein n=1 Tax=Massilia sp. R2A-15 TaxID=3064278 RepID=UPI002735A3B9|nr:EAL domain-containing protein [Massilia sp. R2A-15]WLI90786.1 EAL domain-containing protein [Massilia sp. R2A-15]
MRISTKLTSVVLAVFLPLGAVGALSLNGLRQIAQDAVENEARTLAGTMAAMASHEIAGAAVAERPARFQEFVTAMAALEKRDLEIVDRSLVIAADVDHEDIGRLVDPARRAVLADTLRDGRPRLMIEMPAGAGAGIRQVAVPVYDERRGIAGALVYEYTPLYTELVTQAERSLMAMGSTALVLLVLALGCAAWLSRRVVAPLGQLTDAALQLAHGRRDVTVAANSRDEIGELASVFNTMSAALRASEANLAHRADQLQLANQALHLRERAIESSFNAIIIARLTPPDLAVEYVNRAFERITGYSAAEAIGMSADFLVGAEVDQPALLQLRAALRERREARAVVRSYRKDGTPFWNEVYVAPVRTEQGDAEHFVGVFNDITDARNDAEQLAHQAQFDALTGLANRNVLTDRLTQAVAGAARSGDTILVAFLDLDGFKLVNDSLGHEIGDQLLREVAQRLSAGVRASDTVARFGGDEFVLLMNQGNLAKLCAESQAAEQMRKLIDLIAAPVELGGRSITVGCSIGIAFYPQDGHDADTLIKHADTAMYRAKELGRNGFQFFTAALQQRASEQLQLGASLRQALERDEFELHYQPQVSLRSGKVVGVEALLRWRHPQLGLVGPGHFIAFAEETGLILPIGEWVLNRACAQNKAWQDAGLPELPVAVNISAKQCAQSDLAEVVRRALARSGLAPHCLELELTESISMADPEQSVPMMENMKRIGVELSIDDFGTGYSNMSYLRRFPIDRLKLDLSFVREITTDAGSLAIADAIIAMSHSLHMEVVAEGVETEAQLALLASRHCDIVQGYYFSKPLAAPQLEALLRQDRRLPAGLIARAPQSPAVLVLDDDPNMVEYLSLVLGQEGYVVHGTVDPDQAMDLLASREVAVVLCDQRMPAMDGIEFVGRVRRMYPDTMRIMLSAYDDSRVTRKAINIGAVYKFIEKSDDPSELKQVVDEAFRAYSRKRAGAQAGGPARVAAHSR